MRRRQMFVQEVPRLLQPIGEPKVLEAVPETVLPEPVVESVIDVPIPLKKFPQQCKKCGRQFVRGIYIHEKFCKGPK